MNFSGGTILLSFATFLNVTTKPEVKIKEFLYLIKCFVGWKIISLKSEKI
nr:MAG TPA: hypothetical protein [Caudoviricetes sp.]